MEASAPSPGSPSDLNTDNPLFFFKNKLHGANTTVCFPPTQPPPPPPQIEPGHGSPVVGPDKNDVLCGRGGTINFHEGNVCFRRIVSEWKDFYQKKSHKKIEKTHIAAHIVNRIRCLDPPGRFLKKDEKNGMWFEIGDIKARKKAGQALREAPPRAKKKNFKLKLQTEERRGATEYTAVGNETMQFSNLLKHSDFQGWSSRHQELCQNFLQGKIWSKMYQKNDSGIAKQSEESHEETRSQTWSDYKDEPCMQTAQQIQSYLYEPREFDMPSTAQHNFKQETKQEKKWKPRLCTADSTTEDNFWLNGIDSFPSSSFKGDRCYRLREFGRDTLRDDNSSLLELNTMLASSLTASEITALSTPNSESISCTARDNDMKSDGRLRSLPFLVIKISSVSKGTEDHLNQSGVWQFHDKV